jgi:hypothetical protein
LVWWCCIAAAVIAIAYFVRRRQLGVFEWELDTYGRFHRGLQMIRQHAETRRLGEISGRLGKIPAQNDGLFRGSITWWIEKLPKLRNSGTYSHGDRKELRKELDDQITGVEITMANYGAFVAERHQV